MTSVSEIKQCLDEGKIDEIVSVLDFLELEDIIALISGSSIEDSVRIFRLLKPERGLEVLKAMDSQLAGSILENLTEPEILFYVENLEPRYSVKIFEEFGRELFEKILFNLEPKKKAELLLLLGYPEDSIARYMDLDFIVLYSTERVSEGLEKIRTSRFEPEELESVFVVDSEGKFVGSINLAHLIKAYPDQTIGSQKKDTSHLQVTDPIELAISRFSETSVHVLPVVDSDMRLIGIVRAANLLEAAGDIQAEKITAFGGTPTGENIDYRTGTITEIFKARFVWLAILVVFGAIVSGYLADQQEILEKSLILAAFIPPIIDMGGNAGSQSASYVIRALGTGQVPPYFSTLFILIKKDIIIASLLGLALGLFEALISLVFKDINFLILLTVTLSMVSVVLLGSLVGFLLPFLAVKLKQDPAVLSAPVITSVMDLLGVMIYLGIAKLLVL
ncbi:MAG: magnesium transporter [Deltaproteobacteria bacterium]|nr:magnesium transporter [Deltaproteobacteria bacterium]